MRKNPLGEIILRTCLDQAFRREFLSNPAEVLRREGISVPDGMSVKIVENTDERFHVVLPTTLGDETQGWRWDAAASESAEVHTKDLDINWETGSLSLSGRITSDNAQLLRRELDKVDKMLVIDFSEVSFMGSAALAVLLATQKRLNRNGQELYLCEVPTPIKNLFHLAGMETHFKFVSRNMKNLCWLAFPTF
jgi:anti-anti-sigma factor